VSWPNSEDGSSDRPPKQADQTPMIDQIKWRANDVKIRPTRGMIRIKGYRQIRGYQGPSERCSLRIPCPKVYCEFVILGILLSIPLLRILLGTGSRCSQVHTGHGWEMGSWAQVWAQDGARAGSDLTTPVDRGRSCSGAPARLPQGERPGATCAKSATRGDSASQGATPLQAYACAVKCQLGTGQAHGKTRPGFNPAAKQG